MPDSTVLPPLVIAGARPWTGFAGGLPPGEPVDVTVVDGRIAAIDPAGGGDRGDREGPPVGGRRIDATGMWLGPGFVDAHVHLVMAGLGLRELDLSAADSREAFEDAIAVGASELEAAGAGPDAWLVARAWDESRWGGERPTAEWLRAAGARPAAAWRMDIHAAVVNAAGLAKLDLREPVPGGTIVRDPAGQPSGLLLEAAAWERLIPVLPPPTPAAERAAVRAAEAHAHARGLVAVGSMEYLDVIERSLVPGAADRTLAIRLLALDRDLPLAVDRMRAVPASASLRLFAAKAFVDGTLGSRTARMLEPYADIGPGEPEPRGLLVERAADGTLDAWARAAVAGGLGVALHAIGDEAVRLALDAMDAADASGPRPAASGRPPIMRIEHAQHIHAADLPRFAGRCASVQPGHRIADRAVMDARLGAARAAASFPLRELAAADATLAFGSDWPVIDCDPMDAIAAAVVGMTREGPRRDGHEMTVAAALRAHTVDAWRSIDEPQRGRVALGAVADLVLLDRDPGEADWATERPRTALTVAAGRVVFEH